MTNQTRQPKGQPTGGQFAGTDRSDAEITLASRNPYLAGLDSVDVSALAPAGADTSEAANIERRGRFALSMIAEPGDPAISQLIEAAGSADAAIRFVADPDNEPFPGSADWAADNGETLFRMRARLDIASLRHAVARAAADGISAVTPDDEGVWPSRLSRLGDRTPIAMFSHGDLSLIADDKSAVAICGARAATAVGESVAQDLGLRMSDHGSTVLSGGAYGIGDAATRGSLAGHHGGTVVVSASGLDRHYPAGNADLLDRVGEKGLLLSALPPGTAPTKQRFIQRQQVLAALSDAVVIVEAGAKSGSLGVAHTANELGIPVGAFPGPVSSPHSVGTLRMIVEGKAKLVVDAATVAGLFEK